jgi:uncharacterized protein YgiM (DUF1202 family)
MSRKQRSLLLIASAVLGLSSAVGAETVYVKFGNAAIRSGQHSTDAVVAPVKQGDQLQVVGRENSWLKVSIGGKQGYIHKNSISTEPVQIQRGSSGNSKYAGRGMSAEAGLAGRGLGPNAEKWAQGKNLNPSGLMRMLDQNKEIRFNSGDALQQFVTAGHVGSAKK